MLKLKDWDLRATPTGVTEIVARHRFKGRLDCIWFRWIRSVGGGDECLHIRNDELCYIGIRGVVGAVVGGVLVHWAEPLEEKVPSSQSSHTPLLVAPMAGEYFPASHTSHTPRLLPPTVEEYFPASHFIHTPLLLPPTAGEYFPASHGVHVSAPSPPEYFPASHGVHVSAPSPRSIFLPHKGCTPSLPPPSAYVPAPHSSQAVESALLTVPAGQDWHPSLVWIVPLGHEVQPVLPVFANGFGSLH